MLIPLSYVSVPLDLKPHQRRSAKALALLNPRTGKMAQESGSGIPELSLGTGQLPHHAEVQDTRNKPLAPGAQAQEPEG